MKKFNVRDRVFLDEAIHAFLRESKKFEEESELLGNRPIIKRSDLLLYSTTTMRISTFDYQW